MSASCDPTACLSRLSSGSWLASPPPGTWRWSDTTPSCCNFGHVGPSRAAALLRGKRLVFIGDSQTRRHLWALVDAVGGAKKAIRRQYGHTVADSHREFDQAAVALNDTLYDSQRAYHAGQTVLLNVDTGRWKLIDPGQLCGVGKKYWMTDHRLVGALRKGHPSPWHLMRGSQYRLRLRVVPKQAGGRKANGQEPRRAVEALARELMHGWDSCKKVSIRDCSYHEAMQRNCARRLSVSKDDTKKASASDDDDEIPLVVTMGEMGGVCQRAANHLQRLLESSLADASTGGRGGGGGGRVAMSDEMQQEGGSPTRRRLLGLKSDGKRRGMTTKSAAAARAAAAALAGKSGGGKSRQMSSSWRREQLMGALSSQAKASLAMLRRSGPVVVDPICVSYCRETAHLECPKDGPTYEQAVEKAAREVSHELAHHEAASPSSLAVLTFVYAASLEGEMIDTLQQLPKAHSYGHGADLVVLGATWASVMRTRAAAASTSGTAVKELEWNTGLTNSWSAALKACANAAKQCILRTVPETPRQTDPNVYRDFFNHLKPLASAASANLIDSFTGTWSGMHAGVMAHHDSTRIHFSDTGRAYLAQLTLNAMPLLLNASGTAAVPPTAHKGLMRLDELVPTPAGPPPNGNAPAVLKLQRGLRGGHGRR